ncbi:MAG TPA: hypothetical protein VGU02_05155 [Gaiellaceae bacterium]|nr:hypothetical protein [Gaiellaceae bacterium]
MPNRRGFRFALEALYLGALAAALAFTALNPAEIVAVMLGGWALVALTEWAGAASRPHYAGGLPPRWHAPAFALPPAQPLEQVSGGYPEPELDEGATWIASAAVREELLSEWPVMLEPEDTQEAPPEEWIVPLPTPEPDLEPEPDPEPAAETEPEPAPAPAAVRMARYHVDPFEEPARGRFGRKSDVPSILVPAKPEKK